VLVLFAFIAEFSIGVVTHSLIHFSALFFSALAHLQITLPHTLRVKSSQTKGIPLSPESSSLGRYQRPHPSTHFTHPKEVIFATEFAQIALAVTTCAVFEDMRSKGLGAAFAGHSLGELSALAAVADILPNSSLVDIMFYHGLTIQHIVERDKQGARTMP